MPSPASGLMTRNALIEVAKKYLGSGTSDVSIQQIARDANVSVGSVYTHFDDKNQLFAHAAEDALLEVIPELELIVSAFEDPTLGFLCSALFHCHRNEFDLHTARIILTAGPLGFAKFDQHRVGPIRAVEFSMSRGLNTCLDAEAFIFAVAGAFQEVLARSFLGNASPRLAERVMQGFALQIGYSVDQFEQVSSVCQQFIAERIRVGTPLTRIAVPAV
jgi:AcrR family transcriptional regulator